MKAPVLPYAMILMVLGSASPAQEPLAEFNARLAGQLVADYDYLRSKCGVRFDESHTAKYYKPALNVGSKSKRAFQESRDLRMRELQRNDALFPSLDALGGPPLSCGSLADRYGVQLAWLDVTADWSLIEALRRLESQPKR